MVANSDGNMRKTVDISNMKIVGQGVKITERDDAKAELYVDGELVSDSGARGTYGLIRLPDKEK